MFPFLAELVSLFHLRQGSGKPGGVFLPSELATPCTDAIAFAHCGVLSEVRFNRVLSLERKRSERSHTPFMLVLLELSETEKPDLQPHAFVDAVMRSLTSVTRETDVTGWYQNGRVLGVVFTELGTASEMQHSASSIATKVNSALEQRVDLESSRLIKVSCHLYPEPPKAMKSAGEIDVALYPDQQQPWRPCQLLTGTGAH